MHDVVIVGAGPGGSAAAYYLAKDYGITDVAVIEKGYIGGGNTGRNTAIVRSNYLTVEGVKFYDESVRLFEGLSQDLDLALIYTNSVKVWRKNTRGEYWTFRRSRGNPWLVSAIQQTN
jgi:sarcosine oxidase subunit beta